MKAKNEKSQKNAAGIALTTASSTRPSDGANDQAAARKLAKNENDRTGMAARRASYRKKGMVRVEFYCLKEKVKTLFEAIDKSSVAGAIHGFEKRFAKVVGARSASPKRKSLPRDDHQLELLVGGEAPASGLSAAGA